MKRRFHSSRIGRTLPPLFVLVLVASLFEISCGTKGDGGIDEEVTSLGSYEVTAALAEIEGEFVDRADYDYAFVMKYKVLTTHRGAIDSEIIYVGHYNPLKPRDRVADARVPEVGGNLKRFRVGDIHRMALEVPIDEHYMGGIINRYFGQETGPVYWALWTNQVSGQ
jgi:hypothetical protein